MVDERQPQMVENGGGRRGVDPGSCPGDLRVRPGHPARSQQARYWRRLRPHRGPPRHLDRGAECGGRACQPGQARANQPNPAKRHDRCGRQELLSAPRHRLGPRDQSRNHRHDRPQPGAGRQHHHRAAGEDRRAAIAQEIDPRQTARGDGRHLAGVSLQQEGRPGDEPQHHLLRASRHRHRSVVNRGGFVVKTTLDLNMQKAAEHSVQVGLQQLGRLGADNGDLLAMDPKTGEILAMVGSADFFNNDIQGQFNVVTGLRQPGSSFKPYVYEQAFKSRKLTMGNLLDDTSRHFAGGQFHDFDMRDMGIITAHKALVQSRNIPALETMQMTGIDDVNNLARDMGITTNLKSEVTTAIGSSEVRMLDHVVGYGVFATCGVRHDPVSVLSITDRSGNTLDTPSPPKAKQVLTPQEAYLITYILKDYSSTWGLGWNRPFAGKSGTTNNYHDAWMMAYAPNLVVGAWVGHTADNSDMNGVYGSMVGSSTLRDFINNGLATAHFSVETFQRPSGLVDGRPCADNSNVSSSPSTSASPSGSAKNVGSEKEIFLPGTECKPAPTPTPSPTPSPLPSLVPSVLPSLLGTPTPSPSPSGTAAPSGVP